VKIGRTHLQDATPLTLGQEFSGYAAQVKFRHHPHAARAQAALSGGARRHRPSAPDSIPNPNLPKCLPDAIAAITRPAFKSAPNKFEALASHGAYGLLMARFNALATDLFQDRKRHSPARSGPRSGLGEFILPGKRARLLDHARQVNPTQAEALTMVCLPGFSATFRITFSASQATSNSTCSSRCSWIACCNRLRLSHRRGPLVRRPCVLGYKPTNRA